LLIWYSKETEKVDVHKLAILKAL